MDTEQLHITPFLFENAPEWGFSSAKSNGSMRIFNAQRCKTRAKNTEKVMVDVAAPVYIISVSILYILYFLLYFGLYSLNMEYIRYLSMFVHTLVCAILIIRFNPLRKQTVLRPYDNIIIFASAIILLTNVVATEIGLGTFANKITNVSIKSHTLNNNNNNNSSSFPTRAYNASMKLWNSLFPTQDSKNRVNQIEKQPILQYSHPTQTEERKQRSIPEPKLVVSNSI